MGAYITGSGLVSPQFTFDRTSFPDNLMETVSDRLACIEPEYRTLINPFLLRRMPRILKMGLASAQLCINRSNCLHPDGIIVGTGLGCLDNLEKFLVDVLENNEHVSTVLPFINSTHNAVAAQISMLLKNQEYNTTYCHRGFSFETALLDAIMLIGEDPGKNILAGGIDECTSDFMRLHGYLNYWKKPISNLNLLTDKSPGTIAGEGSGFFMLSGKPPADSHGVEVIGVDTFLTEEFPHTDEIWSQIQNFLQDHYITPGEIEGILLGINGNFRGDQIYYELTENYFSGKTILYYKHLCGEYYTSGAFAFWVASVILGNNTIPDILKFRPAFHPRLNNILIYNQVNTTEHSLIYLKYDRL